MPQVLKLKKVLKYIKVCAYKLMAHLNKKSMLKYKKQTKIIEIIVA